MSETPAVSLLIPIYNVERYLEECLVSAEAQTLRNIEIICINDGSTDESPEIIRRHMERDPRIKLVDKANSGYGDSMNQGIEAAQGEYLAILESDDILDAEALEYMYTTAVRDRLDVLKCNFFFYWSQPSEQTAYRSDLYFSAVTTEMIAADVTNPRLHPHIFFTKPSIWSALYRRDFLNENNIRFLPTPGASYQDAGFTFKVYACAQRVRFSGRAFLHYRQDNENSSVNNKGKVYCICDEHAEMKRFLVEEHPELAPSLNPMRARMKYLNYRWNYDRIADEFKPEFLARMVSELREEVANGCINLEPMPISEFDAHLWDFRYFTEMELNDIAMMLDDPTYFATRAAMSQSSGKLETVKAYYSQGGVKYVTRVIKEKLRGQI